MDPISWIYTLVLCVSLNSLVAMYISMFEELGW